MSKLKQLSRRDLIKAAGMGALATSFAGCQSVPNPGAGYRRPYSRKPWVAPRVSMDNVIREIVGHRPYRPSGFVVKGEQFDEKLVVHNYGHGGGGISLSWGSSALAVRETLGMTPAKVAVIGGGVMGLTSARLLQDAGWEVTIYTRDMARHTTSSVAGGEWGPYSVHDPSISTHEFKSQIQFAARIAHHAFTTLGGTDYGVHWTELYNLSDSPPEDGGEFEHLYPFRVDLQPDEHPFPAPYVRHELTMMVEPATFLRRLIEDFQQSGGRFVIRNFANKEEILALPEPVMFNCTGLGAATLFDDTELTPAKGQLVYLPPDPDVDYLTIGGGNSNLYMFSRTDAVLLGGTFKLGDYSRNTEPEETERIVTEHQRIFSGF
ncbi:MAG: FAD-dependent oxidoreductase [Gammaproteobacteria bacterium]|nr:FAD-dependent oxidoreductase [Gammaproteobacteria bacterium]